MSEVPALDWANLKCRWAAYFGGWPAWVDGVVIPCSADADLLHRQFNAKIGMGEFEYVKARVRENMSVRQSGVIGAG